MLSHLFIFIGQGNPAEGEKREQVFLNLLQNLHNSKIGSPISFEILGKDGYAYFFITVDSKEKESIESIIYANFPSCEIIDQKEDPFKGDSSHAYAYRTVRSDIFPIKNYEHFNGCSIANIISVIEKTQGDVWYQVIIQRQEASAWYHLKRKWKKKFFSLGDVLSPRSWFHPQLRKIRKVGFQEAEEKLRENVFATSINIAAKNDIDLKSLMRSLTPYNRTDINGLAEGRKITGLTLQKRRQIYSSILSCKEIASIHHYPNPDFTSHVVHMQSRRAEAPRDIPKSKDGSVSLFGQTNYHGSAEKFGIRMDDRQRHFYMVGKSGSGKSKCLELLIGEDIKAGRGFALLDPHGDLIDNILRIIPENRIQDVIIFDPYDLDNPVAFNPLERVAPEFKMQVTIGFISIFKKLFGPAWTPRLEHVLRYTVLALLDTEGTTTLSILKMLSDKDYRQKIVAKIEDSVVKNFWVSEFAAWSEKFDAEAITPLLNKVGQFVATDVIRNIVGQPKSAFKIRDIMDSNKILLVKVSKGLLGEENAELLGAMFITKIYESAMSRADTPEEQRKNFSLYVDEFQNFATDTFAEILSEARKYKLSLTIAHQYMGQLANTIQKTVFGNVGSIISFRVGAEDAKVLAEEYAPIFTERDIINLGVREFYAKLSIKGEIREAFSGKTLDMAYPEKSYVNEIKEASRSKFGTPKKKVVELLRKWEEKGTFGKDVKFEAPII